MRPKSHKPDRVLKAAAHLPELPIGPTAYERLYEFNSHADDYLDRETCDWQVTRIPPGLTEEEVYHRLPSSPRVEFGGYLTRTQIRYLQCGEDQANTLMSRPCTFHTHPTSYPLADLPSVGDVYSFLAYRHVRAITVGAAKLWVWDKTRQTVATVRKLSAWLRKNMVAEVRRLERKYPDSWEYRFMKLALKNIGLPWPRSIQTWSDHWPEMLGNLLRIKVRVFSRP